MYDVVIIGAGPAGCTAAKILAENGYRVLVAEKFCLPRYKSCSGVLIKKSMDLVVRYLGENTPKSTMCLPTENHGMIFTNDRGREYRFEQEGLNVWRSAFDAWLASKAQECGAEVRDHTTVISCEEKEDYVVVRLNGKREQIEKARFVMDCEGAVGSIKRKITGQNLEYITTFQTFHIGSIDLDPHYFYAYLQPALSEYDAWFHVKDDQLVLGVSVKNAQTIPMYYDRFLAYMQDKHRLRIEKQIRTEKWLMPHIRRGCHIDYGIGRILFAGETAGFLNPMGEGISAGMESGYCAASAISRHFNYPDRVFDDYRKATEPLRNYMQRQWAFVAGMADTFSEMQ